MDAGTGLLSGRRGSARSTDYFSCCCFFRDRLPHSPILAACRFRLLRKYCLFTGTIVFPNGIAAGKITGNRCVARDRGAGCLADNSRIFGPVVWRLGVKDIRRWANEYFRLGAGVFRVNLVGKVAYRINFLHPIFPVHPGTGDCFAGDDNYFLFHKFAGRLEPAKSWRWWRIYYDRGHHPLCLQPGMEHLIESVRDGTFDFTLTKPEDAQLITGISRFGIWE